MTVFSKRSEMEGSSSSSLKKKFRSWGAYLILGVLILVFTLLTATGFIHETAAEFVTDTIILVGVYAILALSLNLEFGFTGLVNFGQAGFFLIGAYSVAIPMAFYTKYFQWTGQPVLAAFLFGIVIGAILSAGVGGILAAIGARLREDYFGIFTLVFAEILRRSIYDTPNTPPFEGAFGINALPTIFSQAVYTNGLLYSVYNLVLIMGIFAIIYFISWLLINSPFGRTMRAVRDDELAAMSFGKNTLWNKIQVMMIGSAIAAVPGAVYAEWIQSTSPADFLPAITFQIFIIAIMGGSSNLKGALLGSGIYFFIARFSDFSKNYLGFSATQTINIQYIITGILLILFVVLRPQGIIKEERIKAGKIK